MVAVINVYVSEGIPSELTTKESTIKIPTGIKNHGTHNTRTASFIALMVTSNISLIACGRQRTSESFHASIMVILFSLEYSVTLLLRVIWHPKYVHTAHAIYLDLTKADLIQR